MSRLPLIVPIAVALGTLSVLAILVSHLALTDIWHGEGDLRLEWRALQISFGVIVAFHAVALVVLVGLLRQGKRAATS